MTDEAKTIETQIDWNIYCECMECSSIHLKKSAPGTMDQTISRLEAELAEYREFVGQLRRVENPEWFGRAIDDVFEMFDWSKTRIASGTDPFDTWKKMKEAKDGE